MFPPYLPPLSAVKTYDLVGCPSSLAPDVRANWKCVDQPANGRHALILDGVDLSDANLADADLVDAQLRNARLVGTNLADADLSNAELGEVAAFNLPACPAKLPNDQWHCVEQPATCSQLLIGPGAELSGTDLTGVSIPDAPGPDASAHIQGVHAIELTGCPERLPAPWQCVALPAGPDFALVGFGADLSDADLTGADLSDVDFRGLNLDRSRTSDLAACPESSDSLCVEQANGKHALFGFGVDLHGVDIHGVDATGATLGSADLSQANLSGTKLVNAELHWSDLTGADLSGADVTGATTFDLEGCPAQLPSSRFRCVGQPIAITCEAQNGGPIGEDGLPVVSCAFAVVGPGVSLRGAELRGADLQGADLEGADLTNANLEAVDLTGANLTNVTWDGTTCPDGSSSDSHGGSCPAAP